MLINAPDGWNASDDKPTINEGMPTTTDDKPTIILAYLKEKGSCKTAELSYLLHETAMNAWTSINAANKMFFIMVFIINRPVISKGNFYFLSFSAKCLSKFQFPKGSGLPYQ